MAKQHEPQNFYFCMLLCGLFAKETTRERAEPSLKQRIVQTTSLQHSHRNMDAAIQDRAECAKQRSCRSGLVDKPYSSGVQGLQYDMLFFARRENHHWDMFESRMQLGDFLRISAAQLLQSNERQPDLFILAREPNPLIESERLQQLKPFTSFVYQCFKTFPYDRIIVD